MRLVLQLVARLLLIVTLCLAAATVWATIDAYRSVDRATAASAQRVAQTLQARYWRELLLHSSRTREHLVPVPDWRTLETMKLISPGVCVEFQPAEALERPLCGQSQGIGKTPPRWFAAIVPTFLGSHAEVVRPVSPRAASAGTVVAAHDARMISQATHHLMASLRDALKRLRNPLPAELGLEASLVNLVDSWRSQSAARPTIQLDVKGDLTDISGPAAATDY